MKFRISSARIWYNASEYHLQALKDAGFIIEGTEDNLYVTIDNLDQLIKFIDVTDHDAIISSFTDKNGDRYITIYDDYID